LYKKNLRENKNTVFFHQEDSEYFVFVLIYFLLL